MKFKCPKCSNALDGEQVVMDESRTSNQRDETIVTPCDKCNDDVIIKTREEY